MKAILFDMDGVILDSMPLHTRAWQIYLEQHGLAPGDLEKRTHGRRNDEIVAAYWGDIDPAENFRHGAAKEALFRELMEPVFEQHLVPGVREFVRGLDTPLGLGSNAERANIDFTLDRAGLRACFHAVVDGNQVERPKPHPDIYRKLAHDLGVDPSSTLVFEDSPPGVAAARAAGMAVVGVDTGRVGLENVDLRVDDFTDPRLADWLRGRQG
jgi:beta-phosphoglucomutase